MDKNTFVDSFPIKYFKLVVKVSNGISDPRFIVNGDQTLQTMTESSIDELKLSDVNTFFSQSCSVCLEPFIRWAAFKSHSIALDDQNMRDMINCLIEFTSEQPRAVEIWYHLKCWLEYVRNYHKMTEDEKLPRMQSVTLREAQTIFFDHVRADIFQEHELRSVQSLLRDYGSIISRQGFPTSGVKPSCI